MKKLADRSKEVIIKKRTLFGTVARWPRPLNRGGRLMEVICLLIYITNIFGTLTTGRSIECGRVMEGRLKEVPL